MKRANLHLPALDWGRLKEFEAMVYILAMYFLCYQQNAEIQKRYCISDPSGIGDAIIPRRNAKPTATSKGILPANADAKPP